MKKLIALIGGGTVAVVTGLCVIGGIRRKNAAKLAAKVTKRTRKPRRKTRKPVSSQVQQPDNSNV